MIRTVSLIAAVLLASSGAAFATSVQFNDFCDHEDFTVSNNVAVGASDASSCDDAYIVGEDGKVKAAPKGKVTILGSDLGLAGTGWDLVLNLKTGEAEVYGTTNGTSLLAISDTITVSKARVPPSHRGLPSLRSALTR